MKYKAFKISHYKGISDEISIDISKRSIHPIIGVNESGKTSILEGILAFDKFNDDTNKGNHLLGSENYYDPSDTQPAKVSANVSITKTEFQKIIKPLFKKGEDGIYEHELMEELEEEILELKNTPSNLSTLVIERDIPSKIYNTNLVLNDRIDEWLCSQLLSNLPYILYFDDFRDEITQYIPIPENKGEDNQSEWIPYFQELLRQVNADHDIYELRNKPRNIRSSIIRAAQDILQEKLAKHWENFSVEDRTPLQIELNYHSSHDLEVKIVEKINVNGKLEDRFFDIKDRSKGFFWYFNFIMKLEFNPQKRYSSDEETI